jgi:GNAT superfamily N-acetyltransferase
MIKIRAFEKNDNDYTAIVALENAVWPDYARTVEEQKHSDATRDSRYLFERFVVEVEGQIAASCIYCEPWWSIKPGKYYINISVHPQFRRRGIGRACYDHIVGELAERDPVLLTADTREDQTDALRFLAKRGFQQEMRFPTSHLDVPNFNPAPFAGLPDKMDKLGIEIVSLSQIQPVDPDWMRKLYDLTWELLQDVPSTDPLTRPTFENFQERTLGEPGFNPDSQFIALDGDRWVGLTALWIAAADPKKLYTGLTGVTRDHRRKRIATAIKVRAIEFSKEYGAHIIETDNEENNPMYQLNLRLGFEPQPAFIEFRKTLKETSKNDSA